MSKELLATSWAIARIHPNWSYDRVMRVSRRICWRREQIARRGLP